MCANDVLCAGAEPLAFLDYIACGRLEVPTAALIVKGIAEGCRETNCALLGGETAEMPSMYAPGKYDLAGYCVGVVEADQILPRVDRIRAGDLVIGLPSSGVHSNGFSLVNKILERTGTKLTDRAPFGEDGCSSFGEELLTPTRLYVAPVLPLLRQTDTVRALAHITGGGLVENVPRVLPAELAVEVDFSEVVIPPIFGWLAAAGNVTEREMLRTFNCGIGMVLIVDGTDGTWKERLAGEGAVLLGKVTARKGDAEQQVVVRNFSVAIERSAAPYRSKFPVKPSSNGPAKQPSSISYKDSGVDITAGDDLVQRIKPFAKSTNRPGVMGGLGGFGGLYRLRDAGLKELNDPILVLGTDGVGTKLKIAQDSHRHTTVGIDLVAMCVNDIICNGADPVNFLDYYACGKLDVPVAAQVIEGIAEGCRQGGSALLGGETAEMPGMYAPGVYDLAGFSLGIVEQSRMLPKVDTVCPGDVIIGLPSSGVHSNGFSLVHKILEFNGLTLNDVAPFSATGKTFAEELLVPTKIYVRELQPLLAEDGLVKALAHITGGGFTENIPRVLPADVAAFLDLAEMHVLPIFGWLARAGNVTADEMLRTFNCGIGMMLVVATEHRDTVLERLEPFGGRMLGTIVKRTDPLGGRVIVNGFEETLQQAKATCTLPKKRIAVLISGSGSNLQALIDATRNTAFGIRGEIVLVVSNKDGVFGLERAAKAGIPSKVILHKNYATRELFDEAVSKALTDARIDLVCLAGFMRILSESFVKRWKGALINIHPALLPKHKGTHAQRQALAAGDLESGCTVHFVDEGVDTGAIILQHRVPILRNDTEEALTERIHRAEHRAYPEAVRLVANQIVTLGGEGQVVWN
ncbi:AGAP009786-PA-like protein [Anopheles sinensis]|uniref:Phosphoribosylformylglycinamidine cyclo-ligase n=1 Tax=Anopheles sinensis TaxID=74873 RepID=A0A084WG78_ANOSI|nr:AGAP009786-PA-like protein [Anopheles sinensis]